MRFIGENDYPDNFIMKVSKTGVRVSYTLNITRDIIPFLPQPNIGIGKKFTVYTLGGVLNPVNSVTLDHAYHHLKNKCMMDIRRAKIKAAELELQGMEKREETKNQASMEFPL